MEGLEEIQTPDESKLHVGAADKKVRLRQTCEPWSIAIFLASTIHILVITHIITLAKEA